MSNQDNPLKNIAALSGLGIQMGVIVFVFVRLGKWLDIYCQHSKKIFVALGAILGVAVGLYVVLKQLKKIQNK
ncbi:AtpZ/AtpI family protein [Flavobacteriaceae bacterium]|nr:AtpZ/AtpI family protein [Flavobacteriaceae bacterium]MDA9575625.1 AtpZ/AtpI family protein [Flavobacteriaceae bacterium]MDB2631964.1 AtpZ/AtpI family protein [Flavobacteriaceae bacterium]